MKKHYRYIVVGNSAAGISAINKLWQLDPQASVLCISDEQERPYNKCFLAGYLSGVKKEDQLLTKIFHPNVDFLLGKRVVEIDREKKAIILSDNATVQYGKLLLATGSSPLTPRISGIDSEGVFTFYSLHDVNRIISYVKQNDFSHVTIMGAGLSGLEAADALRSQNLDVTIIEQSAHVLPRQIDSRAASFIQERMKQQGVSLVLNKRVAAILPLDGKVNGLILSDGTHISTQIIICATGLQANSELARTAGLRLINSSIWVDQNMQTSDEHIYAAGDVVAVKDQLTDTFVPSCTWPDAMHQGLIAAHGMSDNAKVYPGVTIMLNSSFFGLTFAACGYLSQFHKGDSYTTISCTGSSDEYCVMFVKNGIPTGFIVMGARVSQLGALRRAVLLRQPYPIKAYRTPITKK